METNNQSLRKTQGDSEKEVHRLGLLLAELFPECDVQTVTTVTNPAGSLRTGRFTRVEEYLFYVFVGEAVTTKWTTRMLDGEVAAESQLPTVWFTAVRRGGGGALRANRTTPVLFYPLHLDEQDGSFHSVGEPLPADKSIEDYEPPVGTVALWPLHTDGTEQTWRFSGEQMRKRLDAGTVRFGKWDPVTKQRSVTYLQPGTVRKIESGEYRVVGKSDDGSLKLALPEGSRSGTVPPAAVWRMRSHFARDYGTGVLKALVPGTAFPFPKSLYAVEDSIRVAVGAKPDAIVLDFFSGSGTTAHAVARLNKQDAGRRVCISITNNEVSEGDAKRLRTEALRPGDKAWEADGIFQKVTRPRIAAAFTGLTPDGDPVKGDYRFTDEFPMADGFEENAAFFDVVYEDPDMIEIGDRFEEIVPILWLAAGAVGDPTQIKAGDNWLLQDGASFAVLLDEDRLKEFAEAIRQRDDLTHVWLVTDSTHAFARMSQSMPAGLGVGMLYRDYLRNFQINVGTP